MCRFFLGLLLGMAGLFFGQQVITLFQTRQGYLQQVLSEHNTTLISSVPPLTPTGQTNYGVCDVAKSPDNCGQSYVLHINVVSRDRNSIVPGLTALIQMIEKDETGPEFDWRGWVPRLQNIKLRKDFVMPEFRNEPEMTAWLKAPYQPPLTNSERLLMREKIGCEIGKYRPACGRR